MLAVALYAWTSEQGATFVCGIILGAILMHLLHANEGDE